MIASALVLAAGVAPTSGLDPQLAWGAYESFPLDTAGADRPFDLGVADIDRDRDLDIFGANHNRRAPLLINDGAGSFRDRLYRRGLAQIPSIAGFEDGGAPLLDADGLYVYAQGTEKVVFRRVGGEGTVTGSIRAPLDFFGPRTQRDAEAEELIEEEDPRYRRVEFSLGPGGEFWANPRFLEVPLEVEIEGLGTERIYLGPRAVNPPETSFTLTYRDRHAVLWAQLGGGSAPDALIVRGGIKGVVAEVRDLIEDELLIATGEGYSDRAEEAGFDKDACRGRGVRPADLGADGDVDVLIECERGAPLLYEQVEPGRFADRSDLLEGIGASAKSLRWVAMRGPGQPQLMVIRRGRFEIYEVSEQGTERVERVRGDGLVKGVSAGDYDGDGDEDLFASAEAGSTLLASSGEGYRPIQPEDLGLPKRGLAASWVDADNDGRLDLHDYQRGLYIQDGGGRFTATGEVQVGTESQLPSVARAIWFDADNDGDRELIVAERADKRGASSYRAFSRSGTSNHWLEVELEGDRTGEGDGAGVGIDALGSSVSVEAGAASRTAQVGESEGSRYSWGHSRLYFGLGDRRRVDRLTVEWSDGERSILDNVKADRLLVLRKGSERLRRGELRTVARELSGTADATARTLSQWSVDPPGEARTS